MGTLIDTIARSELLAVLGLLALVGTVPSVCAYRVLGIFPIPASSHNVMFEATMQALADSGHEVVDLSPFPLKQPRANYTDVDLSKELPTYVNSMKFTEMVDFDLMGLFDLLDRNTGPGLCRKVFQTKQFQDIMSGAYGKFDVVFTEICGSDCWGLRTSKIGFLVQNYA
ncbi:uncharacterized protein LOC117650519 [Thrips palmi]|uniref:Uncharacterized protein LOC117650519 n=1 Tax=Thrips palmi TaxID=161013 RepID=A0A6P8ZXT0_THRPL|nr:uncharacterized protein LOC117650519 [Thrips palmi]